MLVQKIYFSCSRPDRHAAPGLKSCLFKPVALKVQTGAARISGRDFGFTVGVGNADIADFKTALCFGKGDFWRNIVFRAGKILNILVMHRLIFLKHCGDVE